MHPATFRRRLSYHDQDMHANVDSGKLLIGSLCGAEDPYVQYSAYFWGIIGICSHFKASTDLFWKIPRYSTTMGGLNYGWPNLEIHSTFKAYKYTKTSLIRLVLQPIHLLQTFKNLIKLANMKVFTPIFVLIAFATSQAIAVPAGKPLYHLQSRPL